MVERPRSSAGHRPVRPTTESAPRERKSMNTNLKLSPSAVAVLLTFAGSAVAQTAATLPPVTVTGNPLGATDVVVPATSYSGQGLLLRSQTAAGTVMQQLVHQVVRLMCGVDAQELPWFHPQMLESWKCRWPRPSITAGFRKNSNAVATRVRRMHRSGAPPPVPETVRALHLAVWGGRRYALLLELDERQARQWAAQMERMCCALVQDRA